MATKTEAGVESGAKHPAEVASLKAELETREVRLASDLELERARLNELNDRLNALEFELTPGKP